MPQPSREDEGYEMSEAALRRTMTTTSSIDDVYNHFESKALFVQFEDLS